MNHSTLDLIRGNVIKQLLYFDEELPYLLEKTSPGMTERNEINAIIDQYRRTLSKLLNNFEKAQPESIVLIGCTVTIQYEEDSAEEVYTIVLPDYSNVDEGFISFISPLARKLLLSSVGDRVEVTSPSSAYTVVVKDIRYRK